MEVSNLEPAELAPRDAAATEDSAPAAPAGGEPRRRILRRALLSFLAAAGLATVYQVFTWPDVAAFAERPPETTAFMERYRAQRRAAGAPAEPDYRWVAYGRISHRLMRAVLVSEDIDFFDHRGFATGEMQEALRRVLEEGKPLRGASTITQQLAKNLWLSPSRNPWRKVKEAILTFQLERTLPKRRILELYLNVVEIGPGIYGAEAAARRYFGKSAADLGEREAAAIAAALPNPTRWHPTASNSVAVKRTERILGRMHKATWLESRL